MCNATQLDASLLNLVINARDAMNDQGQICIATRVVELTDDKHLPDGSYVELTVRDTGPGMTATVAKNAFEPFFTTKELDKGTGLGLSQVAGFALKSEGAAFIKQTSVEGTTIAIQLKIVDRHSLP
jgi:signal transduction histidine kinase